MRNQHDNFKTARTFDVIAFLLIMTGLAYLVINGVAYAYSFIHQLIN